MIYFGNDETSIDKCLAIRRGEADSIAKIAKVPPSDPKTLASGYVSTDGIAQIANIIGLKFASETSEDSEVQSAIAGILPKLLRTSIREITWTATKTEEGIEDEYHITTKPEIAQVFSETFSPGGEAEPVLFSYLSDVPTATRYNLKDPQVAWRSVLIVVQKQTDPLGGKIIGELSGALFEPYGIRDPEMFLSSVDSNLLTANVDVEGEKPFVVATMRDLEKVKKSIVSLKPNKMPTEEGINFWTNEDNEIEAVFMGNSIIIGSVEGVGSGFEGGAFPGTTPPKGVLDLLIESKAPITTIGRDIDAASANVEFLSEKRYPDEKKDARFITETRFTKTGIERRTVSDFGLIGSIIAQLAQD